ncbi:MULTISPECIES: flagellar protein FlaG [Carnobacterium]|uniref:flagellar protein FlaG n=1 Tax=Carnobacterium TaxID=2747 RepID=UPI00203DE9B7|nr:flagellar protein FlaG [Carnobacterium inhibens]MCM3511874.1 flagellar protein FlaG [Carnobacterium inhibens]
MDFIQAVTKSLQIRPIESNTIHQSDKHSYIKGTIDSEAKQEPIIVSEITKEELDATVEKANRFLLGLKTQFDFKIHEGTGRTVVRLIDKQTQEVVKEIPPEKMLDVLESIWDSAGILVDRKE